MRGLDSLLAGNLAYIVDARHGKVDNDRGTDEDHGSPQHLAASFTGARVDDALELDLALVEGGLDPVPRPLFLAHMGVGCPRAERYRSRPQASSGSVSSKGAGGCQDAGTRGRVQRARHAGSGVKGARERHARWACRSVEADEQHCVVCLGSRLLKLERA